MNDRNHKNAEKLPGSKTQGRITAGQIILDSINWLYREYSRSNDRKYLNQAVKYVEVYLDMGLSYGAARELFNNISRQVSIRQTEAVPGTARTVQLNKVQIRELFRKWNPCIHSMKIEDVLDDIIDKVENEKDGIYFYTSGQLKEADGETTPKDLYKLSVLDGKFHFFDIRRKLYYTIKK